MHKPMLDRDLLYPTMNRLNPGSVHVVVIQPDIEGKMPIIISPKTDHNPLDYIDTVIGIIQADIFDKTRINIKLQGIFFFLVQDGKYIKLVYQDGEKVTEEIEQDFE